jgi:hypothetical protein
MAVNMALTFEIAVVAVVHRLSGAGRCSAAMFFRNAALKLGQFGVIR